MLLGGSGKERHGGRVLIQVGGKGKVQKSLKTKEGLGLKGFNRRQEAEHLRNTRPPESGHLGS